MSKPQQLPGSGVAFLGVGTAFLGVSVDGQPVFLGIGLAFNGVGIAFLARSRQADRP